MALYFRTWKMAVAGLVALLHDLVITVGIYALAGFEVSPATMIGFLTILGYSLYDTVVVFDKVRENTTEALGNGRMTYAQAANLAVNQTLVRSINTTVVALLPIAAILVIGFVFLGPGTLLDLALALFVGIAVGAYSSIFIATPLLVHLRMKEPAVVDLDKKATRYQARHGGVVVGRPTPRRSQHDAGRRGAGRGRGARAGADGRARPVARPRDAQVRDRAARATSPSARRSHVDERRDADAGADGRTMSDSLADRVAARLRDVPDFPSPGILFKDITPLLADAAVVRRRRSATWPTGAAGSVDVVVGIEARGFIFGAALAHELGVGFVPVRKAGKLPGETVSA